DLRGRRPKRWLILAAQETPAAAVIQHLGIRGGFRACPGVVPLLGCSAIAVGGVVFQALQREVSFGAETLVGRGVRHTVTRATTPSGSQARGGGWGRDLFAAFLAEDPLDVARVVEIMH